MQDCSSLLEQLSGLAGTVMWQETPEHISTLVYTTTHPGSKKLPNSFADKVFASAKESLKQELEGHPGAGVTCSDVGKYWYKQVTVAVLKKNVLQHS